MLWKMRQNTFASGRLDKELMGRQDLAAYFKGASELKNFVVRRQGGISKRRGTNLCCNLAALGDISGCRLVPLVYDRDEGYYVLFFKMPTGATTYDDNWKIALLSRDGVRNNESAGSGDPTFDDTFKTVVTSGGPSYNVDTGIPTSVDISKIDYFQSGDKIFVTSYEIFPRIVTFHHDTLTLEIDIVPINESNSDYSSPGKPVLTTSGDVITEYSAPAAPTCTAAAKSGTNKTAYYKICYVDATGAQSPVSSSTSVTVGATSFTVNVTCKVGSKCGYPSKFYVYRSYSTTTSAFLKVGEVDTNGSNDVVFTDSNANTGTDAPSPASKTPYYYSASYVGPTGIQSAASPSSDVLYIYSFGTNGTVSVACTKGDNTENPTGYVIYRGSTNATDNHGKIGEANTIASDGSSTFSDDNSVTPGENPGSTGAGRPTCTAVQYNWHDDTGGGKRIYYECVAVFEDGSESRASDPVEKTYVLPWPNTGKYIITCNKGTLTKNPVRYKVFKKNGSEFGLIGVTSKVDSSFSATFDDNYITPDLTTTPLDMKMAFASEDEYPNSVAMYQQRLVFAGTRNEPFTFFMSATGDLYQFNSHSSLREDDPVEASLSATEMPEINHIVMSRDLILFTTGGEWEVAPVSGNAISYKTVSVKMQSAIGSSRSVKPITIGDEIIFVDGSGENMLSTRYSYSSDGYESKDLTILSRWIFHANGIVRTCYKRSPDSSIVCVLGNGEVATLAYMSEHEVCAWSRQVLSGGLYARDCASSKCMSNGTTEVMLLASNEDKSEWCALIVRDDVPARSGSSVSSQVCMDACASLVRTDAFTVESGKAVVNTSTAAVYASGSTAPAGTYVIGCPFESELVTAYPEPQGNDTVQMEIKNATEVEARVVDSSTFSIGANAARDRLRAVDLAPSASSGAITLRDADVRLPVTGANTRDGRMAVVHSSPFTFNLTSLNTTYQVEMANLSGSGGGNG